MNNAGGYLIGLYLAITATLVSVGSYVIVQLRDRRVKILQTFADAPVEPFPRARFLRVTAQGIRFAYFALLASVPLMLALAAFGGLRASITAIFLVMVFLGMPALFVFLSTIFQCPKCTKRPIMNAGLNVAFPERLKGLSPWGSVIKRIATEGQFRCMYCGQRYTT